LYVVAKVIAILYIAPIYWFLDRCHTCNFIARFCSATLSRDKVASVTWRVAQLLVNSRATHFSD